MKWKDILKQEWKIRPCRWLGTECWCRKICTKSGYTIISGARLRKDVASYFVALHNRKLRQTTNGIRFEKFANILFYDDDDIPHTNQLNRKWKMKKCGVKKCHCRTIKTVYRKFLFSIEGVYIIDAGNLNKEEAQYFVKLHNEYLKERKKQMAMSKKRKKKIAEEQSIKSNMTKNSPKKNESKKKGKRKPKKGKK